MKKILSIFVLGIMILMLPACSSDKTVKETGGQTAVSSSFSGLTEMAEQSDLVIQLQDGGLVKNVLKGKKELLYSSMADNSLHVKRGINDILFLKKTPDNTYEFIDSDKKNLFHSGTSTPDQYQNSSGDTFMISDLLKGISPPPVIYHPENEKKKSFSGLQNLTQKSDIVIYFDGYLGGYHDIKNTSDTDFENSDFCYKNIKLSAQDVTRILFVRKSEKGYQYMGGVKNGCFTNKKGLIYKNANGDIINIRDILK